MELIHQIIEEQIEKGFRQPHTLEPIRCFSCGHDVLLRTNGCYEEYHLAEYDLTCAKCGKISDTWSYGHWQCEH